MVAFSRLPDACQLALFKQLPPEDQLRARSVCRKWDSLIPVAASTRRSLVVIIGDRFPRDCTAFPSFEPNSNQRSMHLVTNEDGSLMFPREAGTIWNSLYFPDLQIENNIWRLIPTTFTGVERLKGIFTSQNEHLTMFSILLELWRNQLTSFHFIEHLPYWETDTPAATRRFYAAINSLSHLKRLVLHLYKLPLQDLPVIARLDELDIIAIPPFIDPNRYATCERHNRKLVKMLQKYGRLEQGLPRVGYTYWCGGRQPDRSILESVTGLCANLRHAFTRLDVADIGMRELPIVCSHFQGLTSIKVSYVIDGNGLVPLFHELSKLKQLIYLLLNISIDEPPLPNGHRPLPQLPSVKALVLYLGLDTPQQLTVLNIGWLFPNLQVIDFYFRQQFCFLGCGFNDVNIFPMGNLELAKECFRQVFRPLKSHFGSQLTILHNMDCEGICSAEELLATI